MWLTVNAPTHVALDKHKLNRDDERCFDCLRESSRSSGKNNVECQKQKQGAAKTSSRRHKDTLSDSGAFTFKKELEIPLRCNLITQSLICSFHFTLNSI